MWLTDVFLWNSYRRQIYLYRFDGEFFLLYFDDIVFKYICLRTLFCLFKYPMFWLNLYLYICLFYTLYQFIKIWMLLFTLCKLLYNDKKLNLKEYLCWCHFLKCVYYRSVWHVNVPFSGDNWQLTTWLLALDMPLRIKCYNYYSNEEEKCSEYISR